MLLRIVYNVSLQYLKLILIYSSDEFFLYKLFPIRIIISQLHTREKKLDTISIDKFYYVYYYKYIPKVKIFITFQVRIASTFFKSIDTCKSIIAFSIISRVSSNIMLTII